MSLASLPEDGDSDVRTWSPMAFRDGKPFASDFGDVYYSGDGPEETAHVFLEPGELAERFARGDHVIVGELGFGTGLNFLCTLKCFQECASSDARLEYYSCERYPLAAADLVRACPGEPVLTSLAQALGRQYPQVPRGVHELRFDDERVRLSLVFEDVLDALPLYPRDVSVWFLDGFAPDRNVAMWEEPAIHLVAKHSAPEACVSTYTASGMVKRALRGAGFSVRRRPGFGTKRHMLVGTFPGAAESV